MAQLGDLTLRIILESLGAEKNAKQFTVSLNNLEDVGKKVKTSVVDLSDKASKLGFVMNTTKEVGYALSSSLRTIFTTIKASNEAFQQYLNSQRQLDAASKLTGANLDNLKRIAGETKTEFSLSATQSGLFTIELTKLGQKAGDISKVSDSIRSLLDLGAGQGLDTEQTLYAIKQAILGIDEGTDKLFQKNPSVLYEEYARAIGTTAGKLTDQQKSQALLNALLESGGKLTGKYSEYLSSTAGKQQELNNQINDAKIKLGEQLQPVLISIIGYANKLLTAYNSLDKGTQTFIVTTGVLAVSLGKLLPLFSSLLTTFPGIGTAASKAGGVIARVFGSGGPVVIAIGIAIWWVSELMSKIGEAKEEAAALERYQERLREGSFIPMYKEGAPSDEAIKIYEEALKKNPDQIVKLNGAEYKLADKLPELKKQNEELKQYGKSWEDMSGQMKENAYIQKNSLKEIGDQVQKLNEQLQNMKPDDASLKSVKEQRDKLKTEYDKLNEVINPSDKSKGGGNQRAKDVKEVTNEVIELQKQIDSLKAKQDITTPGTALFAKYENDIKAANDQIKFLNTSITQLQAITSKVANVTGHSLSASDLESIAANVEAGTLAPIDDKFQKWQIARQEEALQRKEMEDSFNSMVNDLTIAYNLAAAISSRLSGGGKDFWFWIQAALTTAIKVSQLVNKSNSKEGIGFGDVLGLIGTVLPLFLAGGGVVPGTGSGDSVPAMLTPGEMVLNKDAVSRIGIGTLQMLNSGALSIPQGLRYANPNSYNSGGGSVVIYASGELTEAMSFKVVDKGMKVRDIRVVNSTYPK